MPKQYRRGLVGKIQKNVESFKGDLFVHCSAQNQNDRVHRLSLEKMSESIHIVEHQTNKHSLAFDLAQNGELVPLFVKNIEEMVGE